MEEVKIGDQIWMTQNLNVDKFCNGDPISEAKTNEEWIKAGENKQPAWCYYDNDPNNGKVLGRLYNFHAVSSPNGLCPKGWHIPTDDEWTALTDKLGSERFAAEKMKSETGWKVGGTPGNNQSKLTILPGGTRNRDGFFNSAGRSAYFWTSTPTGERDARDRGFEYNSVEVVRDFSDVGIGFSCRCVKVTRPIKSSNLIRECVTLTEATLLKTYHFLDLLLTMSSAPVNVNRGRTHSRLFTYPTQVLIGEDKK